MKIYKSFLIFIFFLLLFLPINVLALCENSHSCILIDSSSGIVLYEKNSKDKMLIASTTKLMTFLVAYENMNLDTEIEAKDEILKMYGTSIYLSLGEKMTLRDLLYGLILRSGNDCSVVVANYFGYDKFISLMNKRAKELGMNDTIFYNPHGLDEETKNYSTSYDMALLGKFLNTIPFYLEVSGTKHYKTSTSLKSYDWYNRNKLLSLYKYSITGKTGYTPSAGKTLVSGAMKRDFVLTAVSLNDRDIYNTHINLYDYGFNKYNLYHILNKDSFSYKDKSYNGTFYINNSFSYPLMKEEVDDINIVIQIIRGVDIDLSNKVGNVIVYLKDEEIYKDDLFIKVELNKSRNNIFNKIYSFFKDLF